jgi:hypothetical protein
MSTISVQEVRDAISTRTSIEGEVDTVIIGCTIYAIVDNGSLSVYTIEEDDYYNSNVIIKNDITVWGCFGGDIMRDFCKAIYPASHSPIFNHDKAPSVTYT